MTDPTSSRQGDRATPVAAVRGFDELEQQLRDLRRALGEEVGPAPESRTVSRTALEQPSASSVAAHVEPEGEAPEASRQVSDQPHDFLLNDSRAHSHQRVYERPSRGVGLDLVLLAGAWAGLIVLVVVVLGRAS
jgi:hypothetical protein